MTRSILLLVVLSVLFIFNSWAGETKRVQMSVDDVFTIREHKGWQIEIEKELVLRFADVKVKSRDGYPFSMMLYFKCDTPDLSAFDSPDKIAASVRKSTERYLPYALEKKIVLQKISARGTYGYFTVLTDAEVSRMATPPQGEYKFITRGMVRLSEDSALGFSIMTNEIKSDEYKELLDYVYSYIKSEKKS